MREYDDLPGPRPEGPHLLHSGEGSVVVETRYRVVDHDDLIAQC